MNQYEFRRYANIIATFRFISFLFWLCIIVAQLFIGIWLVFVGYGCAVLLCMVWNSIMSIIGLVNTIKMINMKSKEDAIWFLDYNDKLITPCWIFMFINMIGGAFLGFFGNLFDLIIAYNVRSHYRRIMNYIESDEEGEKSNGEVNDDRYIAAYNNKISPMSVPVSEKKKIVITPGLSIESLLTRISVFIEDKEWDKALAYSEAALDNDAKNASVYIYRLMIAYKVNKITSLADYDFSQNVDFLKFKQYGDEDTVEILNGFLQQKKEEKENKAKIIKSKKIEKHIDEEEYYQKAVEMMNYDQIYSIQSAINYLGDIPNYKDSKDKIEFCKKRIEILKEEAQKREELRKNNIKIQTEEQIEYERNAFVSKLIRFMWTLPALVFLSIIFAVIAAFQGGNEFTFYLYGTLIIMPLIITSLLSLILGFYYYIQTKRQLLRIFAIAGAIVLASSIIWFPFVGYIWGFIY